MPGCESMDLPISAPLTHADAILPPPDGQTIAEVLASGILHRNDYQ